MATEFERIKAAVETEKRKMVQAETRIQSLTDERSRLFSELAQDLGRPISTIEEAQAATQVLRNEIETGIEGMKKILDAEGVSY